MYFFLYLWTDKSRKWSLRMQRGGTGKRNTQPTNFPQYQTSPHSQKLRQRCRPLSCGRAMMGQGIEYKQVSHSPLHPEQSNQKFIDINTSQHLNPLLLPSTNQKVQQCADKVLGGGGCIGVCLLHTFINRNYVTEFPEHELQATHQHINCTDLGGASK